MSAVAMPVSGRRNARATLRSVPTGPRSRGLRRAGGAELGSSGGGWPDGPAGLYVDGSPAGLYVDGSLAGVLGDSGWADGASGAPRRTAGARAGDVGEAAVRRPGLRLTRRGRLTRTLVCFGVLCLLVSLAFARLTAPGPLVADHATVVQPGQTLTDIARTQLSAHPVEHGVEMLRELNGMNSTVVVAGQSLLIPAP